MTLLKILPILAFQIAFLIQARGEWDSGMQDLHANRPTPCRSIEIHVRDSCGTDLMDAGIAPENTELQYFTNFKGIVEIPSVAARGPRTLNVTALGYRSAKVVIPWGNCTPVEVELDRKPSDPQRMENAVGVREMPREIRIQSHELQMRATAAMRANDYEYGELLLLHALTLTPSDANIINALGILALRCNALDAAGAWFEKTAILAPYSGEFAENLGWVRWMQQRRQESYDLLIKAEALGTLREWSNYIIGVISLAKGMDGEAIEHLEKISARRFPDRDLHLSTALRNIGKSKAAEERFRNYLKHQSPSMAQIANGR